MRFATKFDRGITTLSCAMFLLTGIVMPIQILSAPKGPHWLGYLLPAMWAIIVLSCLPQYYEVREDGLFIRQGLRQASLPYESLAELRVTADSRKASVFTNDRLLIGTRAGKQYVIAPAEAERFIDEVARRAPQLERKSFGLGLPLSSLTS